MSAADTEPARGAGVRKGRGAGENRVGRYEALERQPIDDGWGSADETPPKLQTTLTRDTSRTAIAWNESPDIPFDRSVNAYRGCEHGCVYCYARPTHAWLGLSPGLDFESRLVFKPDVAAQLREELSDRSYDCAPIALGTNTDLYQPVDRRLGLAREVLELLSTCDHPVKIVTKSSLIERDVDLLASMAERRLCTVHVSVTTLDHTLARRMEPRATAPRRRVETIRRLADAGVPVGVMVAPVIPALNDTELEDVLEAAREAGAAGAGYILIRLPLEVRDLFQRWLEDHYPLKAEHVMTRIRDTRGGRDYDSSFGQRMTGSGAVAALVARRFQLAERRLGFPGLPALDATRFRHPQPARGQLSLL